MILDQKIPDSLNFTYKEFIDSNLATKNNIDNIPKDNQIFYNIELLVKNCIQPIRDNFGPIRILSGYRCKKLNDLVGSNMKSNHLHGYAADIEPVNCNVKLIDILIWIQKNLKWKELIAENFPNGWIHIAFDGKKYSKQIKLKDKRHNYTLCSIGYITNLYKGV